MEGFGGCVPQDYSIPALPLFIGDGDLLLTKVMICFAFMLLEKYENLAVLVRNVGFAMSFFGIYRLTFSM